MTRASSAVGTTTRAGTRQWAALVVLMLPVLLVSIDNTVLSFALPEISTALRPSAAGQLWIVDVYSLVLAGLLVAMGGIGDRFGRRRMLLIGATGFALVSVLAAFAPTAPALIAARAALGFFGAMLMPSTLSLIRSTFPHRGDRRLAIAVWATAFSVPFTAWAVTVSVALVTCSCTVSPALTEAETNSDVTRRWVASTFSAKSK